MKKDTVARTDNDLLDDVSARALNPSPRRRQCPKWPKVALPCPQLPSQSR